MPYCLQVLITLCFVVAFIMSFLYRYSLLNVTLADESDLK